MEFRNIFKTLASFRTKKYFGLLPGNLPVNAQRWGQSEYLNALDISLYTDKAISKRADKVGEIQFQLQDAKGNEIENHPLLTILNRPNKVFTGRQFWSLYQKYFDACGEVYILLESTRQIFEARSITAMHLLIPTCVTPKFNDDGTPEKFEYKTGNKTVEYKPEEIIYVHNPDPKNPLRGRSLLKTAVFAIQTETQIATYHSRILENGGKVEGVFKFKTGQLTENQLVQIKDKYQKEYAEAKRAGLPLFLGGDAEYVKTGLTPDELSFLEAKGTTLEDICIATSVPKSMLASTADVKFDNADADRAIFLRETIKPLLTTLTSCLDYTLFPDNITLTFIDPTPENIEQKLKETESGVKNYYMTINEARERHGLDPIDNGDEILVPFNLSPLGSPAPAPAPAKGMKNKAIEHPLRDADVRRLYWEMQMKRMDSREKKFNELLNTYFKGQETRLIEALSPAKTRYFRSKGLDELLTLELEVKIGKKLFIPLLTDLLKQAGVDAMDLAGSTYDFNITTDIVSWLENKADIFLTKINETTFEKLRSEFSASFDAGENRDQLVNRIRDTYGNIGKSRAQTIARTEVHNATQFGTMQGYKQAGLTTKIWVAVMDGATRDSHAAVDGEERPIDRPFTNGLMFPGDPAGAAEEVINCRCVI